MFADDVSFVRVRVVDDIDREQGRRADGGQQPLSRDDQRRMAGSRAQRHLQALRDQQLSAGESVPPESEDPQVVKAVLDGLFGMGPMQSLLDDQSLTEVNFNGVGSTWGKRRDGSKEELAPAFSCDEELKEWVQAQGMYNAGSSRAWDTANPVIELQLPGGHRLVGIRDAGPHPYVSIRLLRTSHVGLDDLRELEDFDAATQDFLTKLVFGKFNLAISGGTESAKTTLLRALVRCIPRSQRMMVVEHFPELGLSPHDFPDLVTLQERPANAEGAGAIMLDSLVRASRRLNPDWLIVGEVMGEETPQMLEAMTQGVPGMTTIHANSARGVPTRIATYARKAGMRSEDAMLLSSEALDFVIHMEKVTLPTGVEGRKITSIVEVLGYRADLNAVETSEVFTIPPGGQYLQPAAAISDARMKVLAQVGWTGALGGDVL